MEYFVNEVFYYKRDKARVVKGIVCKDCIFHNGKHPCTRFVMMECFAEYRTDCTNVTFENINLSRF